MRRSKIVGFSLPPAIHQKLESLIKRSHKTKSEFFREILDVYFRTVESVKTAAEPLDLIQSDLAKILQTYWTIKATTPLKIIIVGLALIVKNNKILIGARKSKDPWVKDLTWVFPGGKIESLDFEKEIKREARKETGLEVAVKNLIAARILPDAKLKPIQIVLLYFHCQSISKKSPQPGGDLVKLKWVKPTEVFKYFTTSTCDEVTKFLATIEEAS